MNTKLVKYAFSICVKENIYDVHKYNEYVIDKRFCSKKEDRLDLPKWKYLKEFINTRNDLKYSFGE